MGDCKALVKRCQTEMQRRDLPPKTMLTHADVVNIIAAAVELRDSHQYYEATSEGSKRRLAARSAVAEAVNEAGL